MSSRYLVDTGVLIGLYNKGLFEKEFLDLNAKGRLFFSVVTINEFIRGAHDKISQEIINGFLEIVGNNLVTPTQEQWIVCGNISEYLLKGKRKSKEEVLLLQNDILIALGAQETKATLVTTDKKDFTILGELIAIPVEFW